jgi:hypothetical protein
MDSMPSTPSVLLANNECLLPILLEPATCKLHPATCRKASGRYNAWNPIANVIFETQTYCSVIVLVLHNYSAFIMHTMNVATAIGFPGCLGFI